MPPLQVGTVKQNGGGKVRASEPEASPPRPTPRTDLGVQEACQKTPPRGPGPPLARGAVARTTAQAVEPSSITLRGSGYVALPGQRRHQAGRSPGGAWFTCTSVSGGHSVLTNKS